MTSHNGSEITDGSQVSIRTELITEGPAKALAGLFDISVPPLQDGDLLPPLWHWIYLLDKSAQASLGNDGHSIRGIPSPPGPDRVRMFAGGRVATFSPLRIGIEATRTARVVSAVEKEGKSGLLTFVKVAITFEQEGKLLLREEQDIVYKAAASTLQPQEVALSVVPESPLEKKGHIEMAVDPVVLFRFSALTYNAHRIHYDAAYAAAEGYPGLVVHGPLQALLMGECLRREDVSMVDQEFAYRLVAPSFGVQRLTVNSYVEGAGYLSKVQDSVGRITATATLKPRQ